MLRPFGLQYISYELLSLPPDLAPEVQGGEEEGFI